MSIISLLTPKKSTVIGSIELDVATRINHTTQAQLTQIEIEDGSNINDHYRVMPRSLTIEGIVSGNPLDITSFLTGLGIGQLSGLAGSAVAAIAGDLLNDSDERKLDAYLALEALVESATPFDVVTPLNTYENMMMTSLAYNEDKSSGNSLFFTANLQQVVIVESQTASISSSERAVIDSAKTTASKGAQAATEAAADSAAGINASTILKKVYDFL